MHGPAGPLKPVHLGAAGIFISAFRSGAGAIVVRCRVMAPVDRLTVRIRDIVLAVSEGDLERWVSCRDIERRIKSTDGAACQAALRRAADEGWLATSGGRDIQCVRITAEGIRVCRQAVTRSRQR